MCYAVNGLDFIIVLENAMHYEVQCITTKTRYTMDQGLFYVSLPIDCQLTSDFLYIDSVNLKENVDIANGTFKCDSIDHINHMVGDRYIEKDIFEIVSAMKNYLSKPIAGSKHSLTGDVGLCILALIFLAIMTVVIYIFCKRKITTGN